MNEYNELVEKLAQEIVEGVAESMEKEAGVGAKAKKAGTSFMDIIKAKQAREGMKATKAIKGNLKGVNPESAYAKSYAAPLAKAKSDTVKGVAKTVGTVGGIAAVPAGAGLAALMMKKKKDATAEKAASILFESQLQKIAAEEAFEEAQLGEDASIKILEEMGIDPEELMAYMMEESEEEVDGEEQE